MCFLNTGAYHICALDSVVRPVIQGSLSRAGNDPQKKPFICCCPALPALQNNLGTAFKLSLAPYQDALVRFLHIFPPGQIFIINLSKSLTPLQNSKYFGHKTSFCCCEISQAGESDEIRSPLLYLSYYVAAIRLSCMYTIIYSYNSIYGYRSTSLIF